MTESQERKHTFSLNLLFDHQVFGDTALTLTPWLDSTFWLKVCKLSKGYSEQVIIDLTPPPIGLIWQYWGWHFCPHSSLQTLSSCGNKRLHSVTPAENNMDDWWNIDFHIFGGHRTFISWLMAQWSQRRRSREARSPKTLKWGQIKKKVVHGVSWLCNRKRLLPKGQSADVKVTRLLLCGLTWLDMVLKSLWSEVSP